SPHVHFRSACFLSLFFHCYGPHRDLPSFPTRRSSDLTQLVHRGIDLNAGLPIAEGRHRGIDAFQRIGRERLEVDLRARREAVLRSEEHTSELQSLTNLVCRLLLEKKKQTRQLEQHMRA